MNRPARVIGCRRGPPGGEARLRRRFTLLEVIIAVTVLLMVVGLMLGFGREMARSWEKLRGEQARFRELLALDRTLDALLSNGIPFQWPDADGEPVPVFVGTAEAMRLACVHPLIDLEEGSLRFAEVFADDGALIVSYTSRPYLDEPGEMQQAVLARNVDRIEFAYADQDPDESGDWGQRTTWVEEWDPDRKELPLAVMLTVHWRDGRVESWLRRIGSGYRERWGKWEPAQEAE